MNVKLISYTPNALDLLLRTKNTRLAFESDVTSWTHEKKLEHIEYMRDTIKSSWEFVDYVFEIYGVTRAFTHQLVRTRSGSYAQESQRTVDVRDHDVLRPELDEVSRDAWDFAIEQGKIAYALMIDRGTPVQDARGILPTNTTTSIVCKFNLRTLADMAKVRLCTRTQGEYQRIFRMMRQLVISVHPWAEDFINVQCVAEGTCAFPRYGQESCKIWHPLLDRRDAKLTSKIKWDQAGITEANPKAKEGKAQ